MCKCKILIILYIHVHILCSNFLPLYKPKYFFLFLYCRLVEEAKLRAAQLHLQNEDVYMATNFEEFIQMCVRKLRGEDEEEEFTVDYVSIASVKWVEAYNNYTEQNCKRNTFVFAPIFHELNSKI